LAELAGAPLIGLSSAAPLAAKLDSYLEKVDPPPRVSLSVQTYALARADEPPPHMLANLLQIFGERARELLERL